jgi:hypothetical protein
MTAGTGSVNFTATLTDGTGTIAWAISPAVGSLSTTTGTSTMYTPPATVSSTTAVTLTASSSGATSATATITVTNTQANVETCSLEVSQDIVTPTIWEDTSSGCDIAVAAGKKIQIQSNLVVKPGVVVKFGANSGLIVKENGSLNAVGEPGKRIVFTGQTITRGFWRGIVFHSNNPDNNFQYVNVIGAGSDQADTDQFEEFASFKAAIGLGGANQTSITSLKMIQVRIEKSGGYGLYVFNSAQLPEFGLNIFGSNAKAPISLPLSVFGSLDSKSFYSGVSTAARLQIPNDEQFIRVISSPKADTEKVQRIKKLDLPFLITGNKVLFYLGALTIDPGATLQFEAKTGLRFEGSGKLTAIGTPTERISFIGKVNTPGYWLGLGFQTPGNIIDYASISGGGNDTLGGGYFDVNTFKDIKANISTGEALHNGDLIISNSLIQDSAGFGIYKFKDATMTSFGNFFSGNLVNQNF